MNSSGINNPNPIHELWQIGCLAEWYLRPSQLDLYDLLRKEKNPFIEAARRFGKTTSILCYVLEKLIQNPGWICRWCEPFKNQAMEIVVPEIDKIQKDAPAYAKFNFQVSGSVYIGPGNSRIYLRGVNEDAGESARGPTAHIIVADEFGSWRDPEYTVNEVLRPQLLTTNGQFIFASSPAADLGHAYYEHKSRAIQEQRFLQKTIYQNESLSKEKIEEIIKEVGGADKAAWRREYLCEAVSDPEKLVIPEYQEELNDVPDDYPRPEFYDAYVGLDLGFNDNTAALFGYWDFLKAELVIEDECVVNGKNSKEIVDLCMGIEKKRWDGQAPYLRIGDNELQQLFDMQTSHGYHVSPTRKDDKLSAINVLRLRFGQGKIKIKKRCQSLRYQLKVGLWNDRKTDFKRGERTGHLDAVDALIYLHRNVNPAHNPYPANRGISLFTHYIPDADSRTLEERAIASAFEPFEGVVGGFK